jgi:Bacterial DNA-binding protein
VSAGEPAGAAAKTGGFSRRSPFFSEITGFSAEHAIDKSRNALYAAVKFGDHPHLVVGTTMADNKKAATAGKPQSKSQTYADLADKTGLSRKQVAQFFDALGNLIQRELGKKGPGVFTVPGLLKLKRITKPATKATTKPNPFKPGEMMEVKAKPARNLVKAQALKNLKEMIAK